MNLLTHKFPKDYYLLLWPLLIEQLFMMLIGNVNVYIYSLYSDRIVASIGIADQIMIIGTMAMGIVSLGSTILFLQNAEKSRLSYSQAVARQTILFNFILALSLFIVVCLFGNQLIRLMQTPIELTEYANLYLKIVSGSLLFQGLSSSIGAVLRANKLSKISMRLSIVNTLMVIAGNVLVIFMPLQDMSQRMVMISAMTVLTRLMGTLLSIYTLRNNIPEIWVGLSQFRTSDFQMGKKLLVLGFPSAMENVSYNFSQTMIMAIIASLGMVEVNAVIYTRTITAIVFTLSVAAGQAGQVIIGDYARKKHLDEMKQFTIKNTLLFMGIGIIINIVIALFGEYVLRIFTSNDLVIQLGSILLWMNVLYDPSRVGNEITIAALNVIGEVRYPVKMGIIMTYLFTVPLCYFIGKVLQVNLAFIWLIFILDEAIRLCLFIRRWIKLTTTKE